jgi:hypothetical protein
MKPSITSDVEQKNFPWFMVEVTDQEVFLWLPAIGETILLTARFCRGAMGHAPIGEFHSRFNLPGTTHCQCMFHPTGVRKLQMRDHLLRVCPLVDRPKPCQGPDTLGAWVSLLKKNSSLFAFPPVDLWDPG